MVGEIPVGELLVKIRADITDLKKGLDEATERIGEMKRTTEGTGTALSGLTRRWTRLGIIFSLIGAGIVYTTKRMIEAAAELGSEAGLAFSELSEDMHLVWSELSETVATAVIPILRWLWYEVLKPLAEWFMELPPNIRDSVVSLGFLAGIILLLAVPILFVSKLLGGFGIALSGATIIAAGGVLFLALAWSGAFDEMGGVLGTFGRAAKAGLLVIRMGLEILAGWILRIALTIVDAINWLVNKVIDGINRVIDLANILLQNEWVQRAAGMLGIRITPIARIGRWELPGTQGLRNALNYLGRMVAEDAAELRRLREIESRIGIFAQRPTAPVAPEARPAGTEVNIEEINVQGFSPEYATSLAKLVGDEFDKALERKGGNI